MIVNPCQNAADFLRKTQDLLEQNEPANNLMLGVCFRMAQFPERFQETPYLATVEDQHGIAVAVVMAPTEKIIVSSDRHNYDKAPDAIIQDLISHNWLVPGVRGPVHLAEAFANCWTKVTGERHTEGMQQRAFVLTQVVHPSYAQGKLRLATEADIELIAKWLFEFDEALGTGDSLEAHEAATRKVRDEDMYIWEDGHGQPVCMAARARPTRNGIAINAVYTPPDLRGRGYATSCVASLSQLLLDCGWKFCTLFTDLSNPTSNSIYPKIGYAPICDFNEYAFIK